MQRNYRTIATDDNLAQYLLLLPRLGTKPGLHRAGHMQHCYRNIATDHG